MTPDDYDEAYALWSSCAGIGLRIEDDSRDGIDRFLMRNPTTCFVAEDDRRIIGTILAGNDGRRGHIYHVAVASDRRREGVGRALTEEAWRALQKEGVTKIALLVHRGNSDGLSFWTEMGFSPREDIIYLNKECSETKGSMNGIDRLHSGPDPRT